MTVAMAGSFAAVVIVRQLDEVITTLQSAALATSDALVSAQRAHLESGLRRDLSALMLDLETIRQSAVKLRRTVGTTNTVETVPEAGAP